MIALPFPLQLSVPSPHKTQLRGKSIVIQMPTCTLLWFPLLHLRLQTKTFNTPILYLSLSFLFFKSLPIPIPLLLNICNTEAEKKGEKKKLMGMHSMILGLLTATFLEKGPVCKYFRLCVPYDLHCNYSSVHF